MDYEWSFSLLNLAKKDKEKNKSLRGEGKSSKDLFTFFRVFPHSRYCVINSTPNQQVDYNPLNMTEVLFLHHAVLHKKQKQEDSVFKHLTIYLPLHLPFLLSSIFHFFIFYHYPASAHVHNKTSPLLEELAHSFRHYVYIAAQGTFIGIIFGHMLLFLVPLSKYSG